MSDDMERLKAQRNQIVAEIRRLQDSVRSEVESDLEEGDPALYEREKNLYRYLIGLQLWRDGSFQHFHLFHPIIPKIE